MTTINVKVEIVGIDDFGDSVNIFSGIFDSEADAKARVETFFKEKDELIKYKNMHIDDVSVKIFVPEFVISEFTYPTL